MEYEPPVPFALIGKVFGVDRGTVRNPAKKYATELNAVKFAGRPSTITQEEVDWLVSIILHFFSRRRPLTLAEIRSLVIQQFEKPINADTLCHLLHRDGRLKTCTAHPIDQRRFEVTSQQIQQYFANLFRLVSGAPAHFFFNVDETGHQDWADAHEATYFVPVEFENEQLFYPVSRTRKRITLIACIAANGSYIRSCLVIPRKIFDDELLLVGYTPEKVEVYSQAHSFIDMEIFFDWFRDTFLLDLELRRERFSYKGPAFLIADNCIAHHGAEFDELCESNGVVPI